MPCHSISSRTVSHVQHSPSPAHHMGAFHNQSAKARPREEISRVMHFMCSHINANFPNLAAPFLPIFHTTTQLVLSVQERSTRMQRRLAAQPIHTSRHGMIRISGRRELVSTLMAPLAWEPSSLYSHHEPQT